MIAGFGNLNCFPQSREASDTCVLCYFLGTDAASCAVSDPLHQRLRLRRRVHQRPGAERELQHSGHQVTSQMVIHTVLLLILGTFYGTKAASRTSELY